MRKFLLGLMTGVLLICGMGASYNAGLRTGYAAADSVLAVSKAGVSLLRVNDDGKVGIGTADPQAKLHATGAMRADGEVYSSTGGFRFPDNNVRAAAPSVRYTSAQSGGITDTASVTCDGDEKVIGGGFVSQVAAIESNASGNSWSVKLAGADVDWSVYAICAKGMI